MTKATIHHISTARKVLERLNCTYAEIRLASYKGSGIRLSGDRLDSLTNGESTGGSIRLLKNGAWGFISFNSFDELQRYAGDAEMISSIYPLDRNVPFATSAAMKLRHHTESTEPLETITLEEKLQLLRSYNDILREPEKIQTTSAVYRDSLGHILFMNTEGSELIWDRSFCGVALNATARDGSTVEPATFSTAGFGGFEHARNHESQAVATVKRAVDLLSAGVPDGGAYSVVADQKLAGVFIHEAFGHLSEADFIYETPSMQKQMVLGRSFGPAELNVYDDGTLPHTGFIPFDDEGILPQKTSLISEGNLTGRLHSRETAARMEEPLSGNARAIGATKPPIVRMTNTYIENGTHEPEELFEAAGDGIYAVDMKGGMTNLEMFTFTSACGYEIKNGKKTRLLKNIVLSGNVFSTLKNIRMIGNDRTMHGGLGGCGKGGQSPLPVSFGSPHLLIDDVRIGGKQ